MTATAVRAIATLSPEPCYRIKIMWLVNLGKGVLCIIAVLGIRNGKLKMSRGNTHYPSFLVIDFFNKKFENCDLQVIKEIILTNYNVRIQTVWQQAFIF